MRSPQGYLIVTEPDKPVIERDTFTCAHCNAIVIVEPPPAEMVGGFCRLCMKNICNNCADNGVCTPFEKRLELAERRDRFFRALNSYGS